MCHRKIHLVLSKARALPESSSNVLGMTQTDNLLFTTDHEWVKVQGNSVVIGITDYAQDALGDVVFVQLPTPNDEVTANSTLSEVESTKSVSDIYAPVSGKVTKINDNLSTSPELINSSPYEQGWIAEIEMSDPGELETLLTFEKYQALINNKN